MSFKPTQSQMRLQEKPPSGLQAELEKVQVEGVQLRREVLRWKMLSKQHEGQLKEIESSASWKILGLIRILPELRHRWKLLVLVGLLAFVSLPFWPLLAILMCFTSGRDLIWRVLWKIQPLQDLMGFVRQKILNRMGGMPSEAHDPTSLVFHRPTAVEAPAEKTTNERRCWFLLQQLCPQRRLLLQGYSLTRNSLIADEEIPDLLSLSRTEMSVLNLSAGYHPATKSGSPHSQ